VEECLCYLISKGKKRRKLLTLSRTLLLSITSHTIIFFSLFLTFCSIKRGTLKREKGSFLISLIDVRIEQNSFFLSSFKRRTKTLNTKKTRRKVKRKEKKHQSRSVLTHLKVFFSFWPPSSCLQFLSTISSLLPCRMQQSFSKFSSCSFDFALKREQKKLMKRVSNHP
jgi:hypothetical protein